MSSPMPSYFMRLKISVAQSLVKKDMDLDLFGKLKIEPKLMVDPFDLF